MHVDVWSRALIMHVNGVQDMISQVEAACKRISLWAPLLFVWVAAQHLCINMVLCR